MKDDLILRVVGKLMIPFILLFALYVQFHGDFGPGGGFQAGVIIAAGIIFHGLIHGIDTIRRIVPGVVNDEVTIDLSGGNTVTSILTSESVRRLGLQEGMAVTAVIKASDVMLAVA